MPLFGSYLANGLYAAISGAGLLLIAILYRDYRIDKMRNELFMIRDELFDFAVAERILDQEGYRQLRRIFNSMLRFCHKISFFRISLSIALVTLFVATADRKEPFQEWLKMIVGMPKYQQDKLKEFHLRMLIVMLRYMVSTSIVLAPIAFALRIGGSLGRAGASVSPLLFRTTETGWHIIEEQALEANRLA